MFFNYYGEELVPVDDFPDYVVSAEGYVVDISKDSRVANVYLNNIGHAFVVIRNQHGFYYSRNLGKIVARAFHKKEEPHWNTVVYLDGDKTNCNAENIVWRPRWFAIRYHREKRHGLKDGYFPVRNKDTGEIFTNVREVSMCFGSLESEILDKVNSDCGVFPFGYIFEYV